MIEETAKDADTEVANIAAEEAAKGSAGEAGKTAAEEAAKGPVGEAGKASAEEATMGPAGENGKATTGEAAKEPAGEEVVDDQPSSSSAIAPSKYLKVGDDLFVSLPGTASTGARAGGEVFDDEVLSAARIQVLDEPSTSSNNTKEDQLLQAMSANFQKLQALYRAREDKVDSRMAAVDKAEADFQERVAQMQVWFAEARQDLKATHDQLDERQRELLLKQADFDKAQEVAKAKAAKDESDQTQRRILLDAQEEDLVARKAALAATLCAKDEEVEMLVVQQTPGAEVGAQRST